MNNQILILAGLTAAFPQAFCILPISYARTVS